MVEEVENLMLEHLKRFQATLDRIERRLSEHTGRLANLEGGQAAIIQHLAAADAAQQVASDNLGERLDRIERRLELSH